MKTIKENDIDFICELNAPCFQALNPQEVELVRSSRTQVQFRKGDNLAKQGTFASYVMFMVKGLAIQYVESDLTKNYNLRIIQPGEFIGLSSVFSVNTFSYSSVAITDCHVFLVEKTAIAQIISANGTFGLSLIKRYSEQNMNLYDIIRKVLYKQMNGRMADALLYINNIKPQYPDIFQNLTRKDLADFAGISTESAVKLLKTLEKDHIVELNGKDINILDELKLQEISKRG